MIHIAFEMEKPGVYALLGTNGAGKTTSIRMILGMLDKDGGEVLWNGEPLNFDTCNIGYLAEEKRSVSKVHSYGSDQIFRRTSRRYQEGP